MLKITQTRSLIGRIPKHRKTMEALGLSRPGNFVIKEDNEAIQGMLRQVGYMVKVEEVNE